MKRAQKAVALAATFALLGALALLTGSAMTQGPGLTSERLGDAGFIWLLAGAGLLAALTADDA